MKFSEAFRETMFRFDLNGNELAEKSGLTPAQVSNFRKGKKLRIDSVERLLASMPYDARVFLLSLVSENPTGTDSDWEEPES